MNESPIFILGLHKSGTTLLRSLLSDHPKLFSLPFETHFFALEGRWIENEYRKQKPFKLSGDDFRKVYRDFIHQRNVLHDPMGDEFVKDKIDESAFAQRFARCAYGAPAPETMQHYFEAIYESVTGSTAPAETRFVEKSVENAEFAAEMAQMFPKAKFITIVRNPYSNIVSLRKYKSINFGFPLIFRTIRTMQNNYYYLYKNQHLLPEDRHHIVRYEDLVSDVDTEMKKIAAFLDIEFTESLTQPTLLGESWGGNSSTGKKFKKVEPGNLGKWKNDIHPMEIYYVNFLFDFLLEDYGYETVETPKGYWRKAKGESLKRWIANRMYKFFIKSGYTKIV